MGGLIYIYFTSATFMCNEYSEHAAFTAKYGVSIVGWRGWNLTIFIHYWVQKMKSHVSLSVLTPIMIIYYWMESVKPGPVHSVIKQ